MRLIAVVCLLLLVSTVASSDVPQTMSYQGVLRDGSGNVVPDGSYAVTFKVYDADAGGTVLWMETQTLSVTGGIFCAVLGSATTLDLPFEQQYWLGVSVGAEPELEPRIALTTSPYAFRADYTENIDTSIVAGDGLIDDGPELAINPGPGLEIAGDAVGLGPPHQSGSAFDDRFVNEGQPNSITTGMIVPDIVSSVDGVVNDGGNVDLIAGSNVTITPDDEANTITIAAAGGASGVIMWSGGCSQDGTGVGWNTYCADIVDYDTATGYFTVAPEGEITFSFTGFYRIHAWTVSNYSGAGSIQLTKNGACIHFSDDSCTSVYDAITRSADLVWWFNSGDVLRVEYDAGGPPPFYAFRSYDGIAGLSRLQIQYVGRP